ncbi:MAG: histidinol-phosphate transaminase [Chloroflexi bacterium]|nr:histidinol-phosphate transaminase [Chloroflexota bacterium]
MKNLEDYVVPWVREAESYSDRHLEFAWQHPDIVRMMSNENPLPPSEAVIDAVLNTARQGNLYPDTGGKLRKILGERVGLTADNVVLGNGSTDVINFILETFVAPDDEVVISVPTFPMYETRTRVNGGIPVLVPMQANFYWDVGALISAVTTRTKLIFLCTPNNPTGNNLAEDDLRRILALGIPTFVDEAYYELAEHPYTYAHLIREFPNTIINRTFSKAYALAGLRIGYAYADERVISFLNRMKIPWNVSLIAISAALAALEDKEDQQLKRKTILEGRRFLCEQINLLPGFRAFPSDGNFVLIDASILGKPSAEIVNELIARGVFVRPMGGHHLQGYIRVTVGSPEQNRFFLDKLGALAAEWIATQ